MAGSFWKGGRFVVSHTPDFLIQDGILLKYAGQDRVVRVPEGVLGIPTEVFCRSSVEEVLLPDGLEWLGDRAFYRCLRLRRLVLPGSLRIVPPELCSGCSALEEVVIPEGVVGLSENAFVESYGSSRNTASGSAGI